MAAIINSLEFTDWLTMECLRLLKNKLFILSGFNSSFAKEYTREYAVGEHIRVPIPWRPIGGEGMEYDPEPVDRRHFDIVVNRTPHVHFEVGAVEEALKYTRGRDKIRDEILEPAMNTMRQKWEILAATWAFQNTPNVAGVLGTNPTSFATIGGVRQALLERAGWEGKKILAISPGANTSMVNSASLFTQFQPGDQIKTAFLEGYLGRNSGFDWQESMSLVRHTAGSWNTTVTLAASVSSGDTTLSLTCTTGDTFKAGDKVSITGRLPVNPATRQTFGSSAFTVSVTADATGASSAATISITPAIEGPGSAYQNIDTLPQSGDALTLWPGTSSPSAKQGAVSLALNKDAFAFCGVKLANPEAVEIASQTRDPDTGLSVAFVKAFDPISRKMVHRFDSLGGFGNFYNYNCAVALAGA